ncbi:hypothetical protein SCLCIDRAFT_1210113, partial [Scleroderma citrinum Foug A]
MASDTRPTRRTASAHPSSPRSSPLSDLDHDSLSTIERLILAQAIYEFGADAWPTISEVVSKHPALARPNQFFSPQVGFARLVSHA